MEQEFLTVQEAAQRAGIGETGIRNAITRRRLCSTTIYGRIVVKASDVDTYRATVKMGRPSKPSTDEVSNAEAVVR